MSRIAKRLGACFALFVLVFTLGGCHYSVGHHWDWGYYGYDVYYSDYGCPPYYYSGYHGPQINIGFDYYRGYGRHCH